ncbi:MAG: ComEC family competence protein, partial [Candidatus Omnitrophica bacterium]|nr:ComEC family competence protein [Candidatus Omnitrophota bacterium]
MHSPLVWIALSFASGIATSELVRFPFSLPLLFVAGIAFLFISAFLVNRKIFFLFLCLNISCLGWFYAQLSSQSSALDISRFADNEPKDVFVTGVVGTDPIEDVLYRGQDVKKVVLRTGKIKIDGEWRAANGRLLVNIYGHSENLRYGDEVLLEGKLFIPSARRNPGCFDYKAYLRRQNVFAQFSTGQKDAILIFGNKSLPVTRWLFTAKDRMEFLVNRHLPSEEAGFLLATLLGERNNLSADINQAFMNTGTMHVIAISGLHVVLIAFILIIALKAVRVPRRAANLLSIILLIAYAFIAGGRPSVVRATIMASIFLFGEVISRESRIENALAISAIIIFLWNPAQLFDVGFQLSFLTVSGIVYLSPKMEKLILPEGKWRYQSIWTKGYTYLARALVVSISAWLVILPLTAYYFYIISPVTIIANLWAVPLSELVLTLGFTLLIVGTLLPFLAYYFAGTAYLAVHLLIRSIEWLYSLKFGYWFLTPPHLFVIICFYAALIIIAEYVAPRVYT